MTDNNISVDRFNEICRICTSTLNNGSFGVYDETGVPNRILKKLETCLTTKVSKNEDLPKSICLNCAAKIDDFYNFREQCFRNELILLQCISEETSSSIKCIQPNSNSNNRSSDDTSSTENNLSVSDDIFKNNQSDHVAASEDDDDEIEDAEDEEEEEDSKAGIVDVNSSDAVENGKEDVTNDDSQTPKNEIPELGEPLADDYVLMKEETFSLDTARDTNKGAQFSILADYLIEFNNVKGNENEIKDRDIIDGQKLRREVLPPMWDVYEKSAEEKQDITEENSEKQKVITVTHRRYIINKGAFPCSLCGECFEFDQGKRRDDYSEDKSKVYDCQTCGKVFPRRSSWKRHQNTHEDVKPFLCRICNKGFNRKEHLSRHLLSHGSIRPFTCESCGKRFLRKEHLNRHQVCSPACAVHYEGVVRPFCCEVCSQGFVRKEHLHRHRKKVHNLDPPEGDAEPKPFTCLTCTKTFTRREHLKRHQLIHQRETTISTFGGFSTSQLLAFNSETSIFPTTPLLPEITLSEIPTLSDSLQSDLYMNDASIFSNQLNDTTISSINNNDYNDSSLVNFNDYSEMIDGNEDKVEIKMEVEEEEDLGGNNQEDPLPPVPVLEMPTLTVDSQLVVDSNRSNTFCHICRKYFSRRSHLLRHFKRIHKMQLPTSSRKKQPQQSQSQQQSKPQAQPKAQPQPKVQPLPRPPPQPKPQLQLKPKPDDENGNSLTLDAAAAGAEITAQKFTCQHCGKMFTRRSHLDRHEKVHADSKDMKAYECVTCGERFPQGKLLDKHMQVHGNTITNNFIWM